ncbi:MAG: PIN domain-containing protein [Planctomycetales bacterium]|nr:PIN domain-containing protein [Planctomycetales bacterium]NIM10159.1 PIN domain-containing protein [Planctomycetales bacterium]NIN09585.1 PIN domain-containing protein [Planctomycetales bacterium]NIN78708.1 PIN domain-containing protein [Planctomycetales bacterium]NIO35885.1 PIN domain-containing protein [Planctomycetales bacterium]
MNYGLDTGFLVAIEVPEHPEHHAARSKLAALIAHGDRLSLAPQVLAEFIHVVTDPRRFTQPLSIDDARNLALQWWSAAEVDHAFPNAAAAQLFLNWHRVHGLGRNRLLDTLLAATYHESGVTHVLTLNPTDFEIFDDLTSVVP